MKNFVTYLSTAPVIAFGGLVLLQDLLLKLIVFPDPLVFAF
jgi:hypothetical protein